MVQSDCKRSYVSKIRHPPGSIIAATGNFENGLVLFEWYVSGADACRWPESQGTDGWARLIVVDADGLKVYDKLPVAQRFTDQYIAFGAGCDFAMGAMAMGATAVQAVECAIKHSTACGGPVEWYAF